MKTLKITSILILAIIGSDYRAFNNCKSGDSLGAYSFTIPTYHSEKPKREAEFDFYQNNTFAVLKKKLDGGYYQVIKGDLYFMMDGEYNNSILSYKIYDSRRIVRVNSTNYANRNLNTGYNSYFFDLNGGYGFSAADNNALFVLEVINQKKELFLLTFKYGQ